MGQYINIGKVSGMFDTYNIDLQNLWTDAYITIQRSNTLIAGMEQGRDNVGPEVYSRIEAEARIIRAWAYYHITFMFGDVPLVTHPLNPDEYEVSSTPQEAIVDFLLAELDAVAPAVEWSPSVRGGLGKGVALGLKARIALHAKRYEIA